jgi:hypothetical protein
LIADEAAASGYRFFMKRTRVGVVKASNAI